jgi:hypothetical protein
MHLTHILKNKLLLQKHYNLQEISIDEWPFWMFEENIKLVNEINEEESKNAQEQTGGENQKMGNFNMDNIIKNATSGLGNLKIPGM